jgi:ATP-dependent Clp protease ATP-binding subunit ClpX
MAAIGYKSTQEGDDIDSENLLQYIIPKDLKDFGLIPEIIGRLPVLTHMNPLDKGLFEQY